MHNWSLLVAVQGNWNTFSRVPSAELLDCITSKIMWKYSRMGGKVCFEHGSIKDVWMIVICGSWHQICGGGGTRALLLIPHTVTCSFTECLEIWRSKKRNGRGDFRNPQDTSRMLKGCGMYQSCPMAKRTSVLKECWQYCSLHIFLQAMKRQCKNVSRKG